MDLFKIKVEKDDSKKINLFHISMVFFFSLYRYFVCLPWNQLLHECTWLCLFKVGFQILGIHILKAVWIRSSAAHKSWAMMSLDVIIHESWWSAAHKSWAMISLDVIIHESWWSAAHKSWAMMSIDVIIHESWWSAAAHKSWAMMSIDVIIHESWWSAAAHKS